MAGNERVGHFRNLAQARTSHDVSGVDGLCVRKEAKAEKEEEERVDASGEHGECRLECARCLRLRGESW